MDRGTWQAIVHRVAQSQIRLKRLSTHTHVCVCVCVCVCVFQLKSLKDQKIIVVKGIG